MKSNNYIFLAAAITFFSACSTNEDEIRPIVEDNNSVHTAVLRLDGGIQHFDDEASSSNTAVTRAATSEWDEGAKLYIQYQTASGNVKGIATYNENTDEWTVDYYGSITRNEKTPCEVYYFENAKSVTDEAVELDFTSAVFADKEATYLYKDGVVHLKTHLMPQTGRIRFRGEPGYRFSFTGVKWYNCFNIVTNVCSILNDLVILTVGEDGYTPYIYADFDDSTTKQLYVNSSDEIYIFRKNFDSSVLAAGKSGYINVPTIQSRNGWEIIKKDPLGFCPDASHPHMIDMGTGVKFACCNVGASSPIEYGNYFAWGEIETKSSYSWSNYKWCSGSEKTMTKYCCYSDYGLVDYKTQLEFADDVARVKWGGTWRMPTIDELNDLISKYNWNWTTLNNVSGYKVTSSNGNVLFFPAGGTFHYETSPNYVGSDGTYWSSSLIPWIDNCAQFLYLTQNQYSTRYRSERRNGLSVRPVSE